MCLAGVRDSKQLTAQAREQLYEVIIQYALAVGVGIGPVELIDERNILQATKYAMRAALAQLAIPPQALQNITLINQFDRRSEEHTSELQSPDHLVCRLLLE